MSENIENCECGGGAEAAGRSTDHPSVCSNHFREVDLTSTPRVWSDPARDHRNIEMILTATRQEFLPGEPDTHNISYERRGGIFVTTIGIFGYVLISLLLATTVGFIIYYYVPKSDGQEKSMVEDDLSWDVGKINVRVVDEKIRILNHVVPSYYRLKIKPNYTSYTYEGNVSITLSSNKPNIKHISLHIKDLEILNKTILLTEQVFSTDSVNQTQGKIRKRRHISATMFDDDDDFVKPNKTSTNQNKTDKSSDKKQDEKKKSSNVTERPESEEIEDIKVINDLPQSSTSTEATQNKTEKRRVTLHQDIPKYNITTLGHQRKPNTTTEAPILSKIRSKNVRIVSKEFNPLIDRLVLTLESRLKVNVNYTLEISFRGVIDESLTGFYRSEFNSSNNTMETLLVTQFEPISARKVFPCLDEPNFKAMFEISIARPANMTVLSNMPLAEEELIPGEDLIWSHFERSVPMSTYLVAFAVSNLVAIDVKPEKNETVLRVWSRKEFVAQTEYAAEIAPEILKFYEKYFGVPYALPKIDLLGIPDFAVGAMENWGMLTFRETSLLLDPESNSMKDKKGIAMVIAHELAHQWFGNLVTMQWWSDIWLNEGFATYLEYIGVDSIEPTWQMMDQFALDRMAIMRVDSLSTTRPVSSPISDESQITQVFDDISYMKAASLLRMLNHILTEKVFHRGLVQYMQKWQYKNADQSKLWEAFMSASNETILPTNVSIADLMNSWTLQAGYPVLNVTRNYEKGTVTVTQNRFYQSNPPEGMTNELWHIPISYVVANSSSELWDTMPKVWMVKERNITIPLQENSNNSWIYFNIQATGHYRVNYDKKNWKLIQYALEDDIHNFPVVSRVQILDDALNLARAGLLDYGTALDMTKHMIDSEMDMLPWYCLLDNLGFLNARMQRSKEYKTFQEYISRMIRPTLNYFGFDPKTNDTTQDAILRDHMTYWACLIEEQDCIDWVYSQYNTWTNQSDPDKVNPISYNNRDTVYSTVLRLGSQKEFNFLYERYSNSNDPEVQADILGSMLQTRLIWQLNFLLEYSITEMDLQMVPIFWGALETETAVQTAFKFVMENWPRIYARYSSAEDQILQSVIINVFGRIQSEHELRQFKRFIQTNKKDLKSSSEFIHKNLEKAVLAIQWRKTKMQEVEKWLLHFMEAKKQEAEVNDFSTLW